MGSKYTDYSDATIDSLWDKIAEKDKRIAELEGDNGRLSMLVADLEAKVKDLEADYERERNRADVWQRRAETLEANRRFGDA